MKKLKKKVFYKRKTFPKFFIITCVLFAMLAGGFILHFYAYRHTQDKTAYIMPSDINSFSKSSPTPVITYPPRAYDYSPSDWQKDAYIISQTFSDGTSETGVASAEVYASHNTTDVLVHHDNCCGGDGKTVIHWDHVVLPFSYVQENSFYTTDYYHDVLVTNSFANKISITKIPSYPHPMFSAERNSDGKGDIMEYYDFLFSNIKNNAPKIIKNWSDGSDYITINNNRFPADRFTIQVSKSQNGDTIYDIIFSSENDKKITALLTLNSSGDMLSFKTY